jgi:superfamily I DNA/RNA helicase
VFAVTNQAIFENNLPPAFTKEKTFLKKYAFIRVDKRWCRSSARGTQRRTRISHYIPKSGPDFYSVKKTISAHSRVVGRHRKKKSIQVSGEVDAVQILTIHKSKGLQFKYVIIPFCSWSLDHEPFKAPNLWVMSPSEPFNGFGYLPVKYSATLKDTVFEDYYDEEQTRSYLD